MDVRILLLFCLLLGTSLVSARNIDREIELKALLENQLSDENANFEITDLFKAFSGLSKQNADPLRSFRELLKIRIQLLLESLPARVLANLPDRATRDNILQQLVDRTVPPIPVILSIIPDSVGATAADFANRGPQHILMVIFQKLQSSPMVKELENLIGRRAFLHDKQWGGGDDHDQQDASGGPIMGKVRNGGQEHNGGQGGHGDQGMNGNGQGGNEVRGGGQGQGGQGQGGQGLGQGGQGQGGQGQGEGGQSRGGQGQGQGGQGQGQGHDGQGQGGQGQGGQNHGQGRGGQGQGGQGQGGQGQGGQNHGQGQGGQGGQGQGGQGGQGQGGQGGQGRGGQAFAKQVYSVQTVKILGMLQYLRPDVDVNIPSVQEINVILNQLANGNLPPIAVILSLVPDPRVTDSEFIGLSASNVLDKLYRELLKIKIDLLLDELPARVAAQLPNPAVREQILRQLVDGTVPQIAAILSIVPDFADATAADLSGQPAEEVLRIILVKLLQAPGDSSRSTSSHMVKELENLIARRANLHDKTQGGGTNNGQSGVGRGQGRGQGGRGPVFSKQVYGSQIVNVIGYLLEYLRPDVDVDVPTSQEINAVLSQLANGNLPQIADIVSIVPDPRVTASDFAGLSASEVIDKLYRELLKIKVDLLLDELPARVAAMLPDPTRREQILRQLVDGTVPQTLVILSIIPDFVDVTATDILGNPPVEILRIILVKLLDASEDSSSSTSEDSSRMVKELKNLIVRRAFLHGKTRGETSSGRNGGHGGNGGGNGQGSQGQGGNRPSGQGGRGQSKQGGQGQGGQGQGGQGQGGQGQGGQGQGGQGQGGQGHVQGQGGQGQGGQGQGGQGQGGQGRGGQGQGQGGRGQGQGGQGRGGQGQGQGGQGGHDQGQGQDRGQGGQGQDQGGQGQGGRGQGQGGQGQGGQGQGGRGQGQGGQGQGQGQGGRGQGQGHGQGQGGQGQGGQGQGGQGQGGQGQGGQGQGGQGQGQGQRQGGSVLDRLARTFAYWAAP